MNNSTQNNQLFGKSEQVSEPQPIELDKQIKKEFLALFTKTIDQVGMAAWEQGKKQKQQPYEYTLDVGSIAGRCALDLWSMVEKLQTQAILNERSKVVGVLIKEGYLKGLEPIKHIKPNHGNCCTCQKCGYSHDECVCEHNYLLKALSNPTTLDTVKEEEE